MDYRLPIPRNWQDFESICHQLWKEIWNDPNAQKNGRQGQADNLIIGIAEKYDAFDSDEDSNDFKVDIDLNISPEIVITETFKN